VIVEGEKKAIKAVEAGINCVAIAGVWCFKSKKTKRWFNA
jgi:DNA primase